MRLRDLCAELLHVLVLTDLKYLQLYDYEMFQLYYVYMSFKFQKKLCYVCMIYVTQDMLCYVYGSVRFQTKLFYVYVYESFKSKRKTMICLYNTVFKGYDSILCFND